MKIKVAYVDEPPFYWTTEDGSVVGSDISLAEVVLRKSGATDIEYVLTTFEELLPGVAQGRWDVNVPIFISAEREKIVHFSRPVWALGDGFVVKAGNPLGLVCYESYVGRPEAKLAVITGTVQIEAARKAGMSAEQMVQFKDQADAMDAVVDGRVDAFVGTAVGNRALIRGYAGMETVDHPASTNGLVPVGGFSFSLRNLELKHAVDAALDEFLGSSAHRTMVAEFGLSDAEVDGALKTP